MPQDDIITSQERVDQLNREEEPLDYRVEIIARTLVAILLTVLMVHGLIMWMHEEDFTDTGVGCVNDCLEPDETGEPIIEEEKIR
jgi:hypothetical protein